ncbi:hypothetical protein D3C81_2011890 [compost metagenome]
MLSIVAIAVFFIELVDQGKHSSLSNVGDVFQCLSHLMICVGLELGKVKDGQYCGGIFQLLVKHMTQMHLTGFVRAGGVE